MASKVADEKATPLGQLSVKTTELDGPLGSDLSPMTTTNSTEKGLKETSFELRPGSALSSPSSARRLDAFDTDIEAMGQSSENLNKKLTQCTTGMKANPNCTVWPGQEHWKQKARAAKMKNRSCQCMANLSKRTKLMVKILIAFLIVGIAVGVGVGISKPLGAGIWKPKDQ